MLQADIQRQQSSTCHCFLLVATLMTFQSICELANRECSGGHLTASLERLLQHRRTSSIRPWTGSLQSVRKPGSRASPIASNSWASEPLATRYGAWATALRVSK